MDSYEKLRRMAEISKSLKKHGLVKDGDEAIQQAEEMIVKGNMGEHDVYVTQERFRSSISESSKKEAANMDKSSEIINALKNMNQALGERITAINSDLTMMKSKMNEIIGKINELENKMGKDNRQEVQATLRSKEESRPRHEEAPAPAHKQDKKEKDEMDYKPSDVAMDKVFYFGKR